MFYDDSTGGGGKPPPDIKKEFGRVSSHPDIHEGRPFLRKKFGTLEVLCILDLIREGTPDEEICRQHPELDQRDLDTCRAYQARFLTETMKEAFNFDLSRNVFMLDENASYLTLYDVVRMFGKSSHVLAEGLVGDNNDDEKNIWAHMVEHKYAAILTSDRDFKQISQHYRAALIKKYGNIQQCPEHVPVVIFSRQHFTQKEAKTLLETNKDAVNQFLKDNDAACLTITGNGVFKIKPDSGQAGYRPPGGATPRSQIYPSSGPSQDPAP